MTAKFKARHLARRGSAWNAAQSSVTSRSTIPLTFNRQPSFEMLGWRS
jgi:hypothetical protein